nr:hypothetical protein [Anaerolineae bacterium]NIN97143.1 hypothetical protein [Anaerolineae bacterium]NIQ80116.1 hypothetical protein [Anaerolineae bacterium]
MDTTDLTLFSPVAEIEDRTHYGVPTEEALEVLCQEIQKHDTLALDTETTPYPSWHPQNSLLGISVAFSENSGYYIPIGHR